MDRNKTERSDYIERRIRHALALHALQRIRRIVDRIEADDRKAGIAVYVFFLLFSLCALGLYTAVSYESPAKINDTASSVQHP